jgi:hypothetical protein
MSSKSPKREKPKAQARKTGRPKVLDEKWARVTFVLLNRQIVYLDRLALDIREETAKAVNRAEVLRDLLEFVQQDPTIRERLIEKYSSR